MESVSSRSGMQARSACLKCSIGDFDAQFWLKTAASNLWPLSPPCHADTLLPPHNRVQQRKRAVWLGPKKLKIPICKLTLLPSFPYVGEEEPARPTAPCQSPEDLETEHPISSPLVLHCSWQQSTTNRLVWLKRRLMARSTVSL